jgi:hypothetical protein
MALVARERQSPQHLYRSGFNRDCKLLSRLSHFYFLGRQTKGGKSEQALARAEAAFVEAIKRSVFFGFSGRCAVKLSAQL